MTFLDIRSREGIAKVPPVAFRAPGGQENAGIWKHRKKDGTVLQAKTASCDIIFQGHRAGLVLADQVRSVSLHN